MNVELLERFWNLTELAACGDAILKPFGRWGTDKSKVPDEFRAWATDLSRAKETYPDLSDPTSAVDRIVELCQSQPKDWSEAIEQIRGMITEIHTVAWKPFVPSDDMSKRFILLFALYRANQRNGGLRIKDLPEIFQNGYRTTDRWHLWVLEQDYAKRVLSTDGDPLLVITTNGIDLVECKLAELRANTVSAQVSSEEKKASVDPAYDVVIVCALHTPELDKLLNTGCEPWPELPAHANDPQPYHASTYLTSSGKLLRVVAGAPNQMGLSASAVLATKMIIRFRPKLVAMVGIAAGVRKGSQGYGDILAAEHTFDYGSGKYSSDEQRTEFRPDPKPIPIHPRLLARLKVWERERTELDDIYRKWPARKPRTPLHVGVGPLASGSAVINGPGPVEDVLTHWRKLIGVEMEAYGVHCACQNAIDPSPMFLCLKSICDFAHEKDDDWQDYAAYTSAELCYRFLIAEWGRLFPE